MHYRHGYGDPITDPDWIPHQEGRIGAAFTARAGIEDFNGSGAVVNVKEIRIEVSASAGVGQDGQLRHPALESYAMEIVMLEIIQDRFDRNQVGLTPFQRTPLPRIFLRR